MPLLKISLIFSSSHYFNIIDVLPMISYLSSVSSMQSLSLLSESLKYSQSTNFKIIN